MSRAIRLFAAGVLAAAAVFAGATAGARPPDRKPLTASGLAAKLGRISAQAGPGTGVWVFDPDSGSGGQVLFAADAGERRILASNTKLFTTSTALDRLGPDTRLETRVWADAPIGAGGEVAGSIYLVGDGDPKFGHDEVDALAQDVHDAGVRYLTGKVLVDDSVFDRRRGLGKHPAQPNPYVGPLSGLSYEFGVTSHGYAANPELEAGDAFEQALQQHGIGVAGGVEHGKAGPGLVASPPLASVSSEPIAELVEQTNEPSNNFFAEMLLKRLAVEPGTQGSTQAGTSDVRAYARELHTRVRVKDGSGIGRKDQTSAEHVGELLVAMLDEPAGDDFYESLPRAGLEGTVANRMEGTAAQGHCRAKTGTISGVSALSGYCDDASDDPIVFSILMNGIGSNYTGARNLQDRMVVAIAQYSG